MIGFEAPLCKEVRLSCSSGKDYLMKYEVCLQSALPPGDTIFHAHSLYVVVVGLSNGSPSWPVPHTVLAVSAAVAAVPDCFGGRD
jgi:hypothetical protein